MNNYGMIIEINPKTDAYAREVGIKKLKILFRVCIHTLLFWVSVGVKAAFKKSLSFRSYSIM